MALPFTAFCANIGLTLTRGQSVLARVVFDGVDPVDLPPSDRLLAAEMFGEVDRVPPAARSMLVLRCGRRGGKTLLSAAFGVYTMCTASLARVGHGDKAAVAVVAPDRLAAGQAVQQAVGLVDGHEFLRRMLVQRREDGFTLRRPDGREVRYLVRARSGQGARLRGFSWLSLLLDEAEFIGSDPSKVIRDGDIIAAAMPALLGPVILASTPWPSQSACADAYDANFGRPATALACRATTLQMRDQAPEWVAKVDAERLRDPRNAAREYDCEVVDSDGLFFDASAVDAAVSKAPVAPSYECATAGMDLAFRSDSSALVVTERQGERLAVVRLDMESPSPGRPLVPSEVVGRFARAARGHGASHLVADSHYFQSAVEHAGKAGVQVLPGPAGSSGKERSYSYVRDLFREGRIVIPDDQRLVRQLKSVMVKALPGGGISIVLPRVQGSHGDLASAFVLAVWYDRRHGPFVSSEARQAALEPLRGPAPYGGVGVSGSGW